MSGPERAPWAEYHTQMARKRAELRIIAATGWATYDDLPVQARTAFNGPQDFADTRDRCKRAGFEVRP